MAAADVVAPRHRAEPAIVSLAGILIIGLGAQFLPFYPVLISAALAIAFSWATTRAPLSDLGIRWPERPIYLLGIAFVLAAGMNAFGRTFLWPTLYDLFGERDLRYLGPIEGNLDVALGLMPRIWFSAAVCEEIIYRGFLQQRLERLFGNSAAGNVAAVVLASAVFAANHAGQGVSGVIQTFLVSIALGFIFIISRHNLLLLILMHGVWDTFSVTIMYFGVRW